jgi:hypothetical protein
MNIDVQSAPSSGDKSSLRETAFSRNLAFCSLRFLWKGTSFVEGDKLFGGMAGMLGLERDG